MTTLSVSRPAALWAAQQSTIVLGLALLGAGLAGSLPLALLGATVLTLAGLRGFAAAQGYRLPRVGHVAITTYGCWQQPLAFAVRRRGAAFLFHRGFDPATGVLPETYSVYPLGAGEAPEQLPYVDFRLPAGSPLGHVAVAALRFEHRGCRQVVTADLDAALAGLAPVAPRPARPRGIAVLGILNFVSVATYLGLLSLALASPPRLFALLRGLAAEGAGAHPLERLGPWLPVYFAAMAAAMGVMSWAFWRGRNWTRLLLLAITGLSLLGSLGALAAAARAGSLPGSALSLFRVGLCGLVGGYLMRPRIREFFARRNQPSS